MRSLLMLLFGLGLLVAAEPAATQGTTTVILVRHAEKAVEPEGDPHLSEAGNARARALADELADDGVAGIIVTEYARTQLTAAPLSERLGLAPEIATVRAGLRQHALEIAEIVRGTYAGRTVLVVGHSNTLPAIIAALGGPEVDPICDGSYAGLYVLRLGSGGRASLDQRRYGAPDPPDPCP